MSWTLGEPGLKKTKEISGGARRNCASPPQGEAVPAATSAPISRCERRRRSERLRGYGARSAERREDLRQAKMADFLFGEDEPGPFDA